MRLKGKTALIVGCATGIGRAVAEAFIEEGAILCLADRGQQDVLSDIVKGAAEGSFCLHCDVRNESDVKTTIERAIDGLGSLDVLVNNAGVGTAMIPFQTQTWEEWNRVMETNLRGVAYAMHHVLPHMLDRKHGRIINTASQLAHKPAPWYAAYCASKAAIVAMSVSVAHEVAEHGVTVNCVCPGPTDTPAWRASDPKWNDWKIAQLPIKRIGTPKEIAGAYVYLASDEAGYMVGQSISPNGGDVAW